jgi:hypothetical protein
VSSTVNSRSATRAGARRCLAQTGATRRSEAAPTSCWASACRSGSLTSGARVVRGHSRFDLAVGAAQATPNLNEHNHHQEPAAIQLSTQPLPRKAGCRTAMVGTMSARPIPWSHLVTLGCRHHGKRFIARKAYGSATFTHERPSAFVSRLVGWGCPEGSQREIARRFFAGLVTAGFRAGRAGRAPPQPRSVVRSRNPPSQTTMKPMKYGYCPRPTVKDSWRSRSMLGSGSR